MKSKTPRAAGILLPITSLPSAFGVGDIGPAAKRFADFLQRSKQKYWQLLPVNLTSANAGYSPYSSVSSMAGNALLISPEEMVHDGLLDARDISKSKLAFQSHAQYEEALPIKEKLFQQAYARFTSEHFPMLRRQFNTFVKRENYWLHDFALYQCIKQKHQDQPWYEWPKDFKQRDQKKLSQFANDSTSSIDYTKWLQFIFHKQWLSLKKYVNDLGIKLFGDLPFYVSHDSVDAWSHPEIFSLDKKGSMYRVAGVPPDYFNNDGQRWGMPVFNWDELKQTHYEWWMTRLKKNMQWYDLLRLDHFRAFADYWEIPAKEKTAKKGKWRPGPGAAFFNEAKREWKKLPFVAEDLGDINEAVYTFRDQFDLPGMLVLQFAFGDDMPKSVYLPHNHTANSVVYTGTHDNNTARGWFRRDANASTRRHLIDYAQRDVNEHNVQDVLAQMAYSSVANLAILPLQDVLGLDESARMNTPASAGEHWRWRVSENVFTAALEKKLARWVDVYDR